MAGNYPQFLSSMMAGAEAHAPLSPEELGNPFLTGPHMLANAMPMNYQNFGHFTGFPGSSFAFQPSIPKGRRKSASIASVETEQVKHRRTRSGCFTCRGRRVKCDEARPICERCRKGGRDCVYPDPSNSKGSSRQKESASTFAAEQSPISSNSEDADHDDAKRCTAVLDTIPDEDEEETNPKQPPKKKLVLQIPDENLYETSSVSPAASTTTPSDLHFPGNQQPDFHSIIAEDQNLSSLPGDYQMHLQYLYENVTCHHYSLHNDTDNFFVRGMIIEASRNQLLLNAMVAFAAYLRSTENPDGKLRDFLLYYNRSITLLLECLKQKQTHNLPTLLSILQLATIEEYLGDWLNLMCHQKAALELFTRLFTPETVMETRIGQICLSWYSRFDNSLSLLRKVRSTLPRVWLTGAAKYYREKINQEPAEIRWRAEERSMRFQILKYDVSVLVSSAANGEMDESSFSEEHERIRIQLINWRDTWDPMLTASTYAVQDYSWCPAPDPEGIVGPCKPGVLFKPPLISSTIASVEWHTLMIFHQSFSRTSPREQLMEELFRHCYALCSLFEALEHWPSTPKGVFSSLGVPLVLMSFILPRDTRHRTWLWRRFALLETMGLMQTLLFRSKMATLFHDEGVMRWWLPDDEGFSPMLQSMRNFAGERHNAAANAELDYGQRIGKLFDALDLGGDVHE